MSERFKQFDVNNFTRRKQMEKEKKKKKYIKPVIEKHESIAVISGSGSSCNLYNSKTTSYAYYH